MVVTAENNDGHHQHHHHPQENRRLLLPNPRLLDETAERPLYMPMTLHKPPRAHHNNNNNNYSVQIVPGFPNIEIHYSSHCVLLVSARNRADVYVCNPCAAQCWSLPARESRSLFATTIDFDASAATNAYRVFAFSKVFIMGQPLIAGEVYSSVTDAWTKRSPIALTRDATTQPPPPASAVAKANGGMYVMAERDRLLRFDVEGSAPTRAVRLPTTGEPWRVDTRCLGVSEGMILYGFLDGFLFRVWELQSDEGWKMRHSVTVQWLWGKLREAAMPTRVRTPPGMFAPLGFHGDVEGVFFQMDERVVVLEIKTKEMEVVYRKVGGMEGGGEFRGSFSVFSYSPCKCGAVGAEGGGSRGVDDGLELKL